MAHNTDERMALADVYAEALLETAAEQGQDEAVAEEFAELVRLMEENPDLDAFLTAASVDDDARRPVLERVFRGRLHDLLVNLLQVLNNRGRSSLVWAVYRCVQLRMERKHAEQEVVVETAMPLSDDLKEAVKREIGAMIGKRVLLIEQLRPELIGGAIIRIDDLQIDASVDSRLRAMRKRLSERATHEIQAGRGYVLKT